ncbi:transmembrane amino acid transporter protein-domain-containing protein [Spinellus fusiger]|nr:transmembrane amino acid transporter protein-domain-containing protein [Spinellus fusiger]
MVFHSYADEKNMSSLKEDAGFDGANHFPENHTHHLSNTFGHGSAKTITAYFHVVCVVAGTGTLSLPRALADGGWIGILLLLLSYTMAVYSGIILIRCLYYKPGQRLCDYKAVGAAAFGWPGYCITSFLSLLGLISSPALYLVLAGGNFNELLQGTRAELTAKMWTIIIGASLLIPSLVMKTLQEVTALAAIGALSTIIAVLIVLIQAPMDYTFHPEVTVVRESVMWSGFPTALATIAFSFGGNSTYPYIEHTLKKPHEWSRAVIAGLTTCSCLYLLTAIPGYWAYGTDVQSPIYLSLPPGLGRLISTIVMTAHVILTIPIFSTSLSTEFENMLKVNEEYQGKIGAWTLRSLIRVVITALLVLLALFIPYFHIFMGLIGALVNCGLVFIIPILAYLKLTGVRNKPWYELCFCALTLFVGLIGCVFGTFHSIEELAIKIQSGS